MALTLAPWAYPASARRRLASALSAARVDRFHPRPLHEVWSGIGIVRLEHGADAAEPADQGGDGGHAVVPQTNGLAHPDVLKRPILDGVEGGALAGACGVGVVDLIAEAAVVGALSVQAQAVAGAKGAAVQAAHEKGRVHRRGIGDDGVIDTVQVGELLPFFIPLPVLVKPPDLDRDALLVVLDLEGPRPNEVQLHGVTFTSPAAMRGSVRCLGWAMAFSGRLKYCG